MDINQICRTGDRKKLKELLKDDFNINFVFVIACSYSNSKTIHWILKNYKISSIFALQCAVSAGKLKPAKWAHNREPVRLSEYQAWSKYIVPQSCSKWLWRNFLNLCKSHFFNKVSDDWTRKRELQLVSFFCHLASFI